MYIYSIYLYSHQGGDLLDIIINNSSETPIYEQISSQIKKHIITGELNAGDMLPSLRVLAQELRISVITTKRAYEELEKDGFVSSVAGKGTFVSYKSSALIREEQLKIVENQLETAVHTAMLSKISLDELIEILKTIYEEE